MRIFAGLLGCIVGALIASSITSCIDARVRAVPVGNGVVIQPSPDKISTPEESAPAPCSCVTCKCKNPGDCGLDGCNLADIQEGRDDRVYLENGVWKFKEDDGTVLRYSGGSWWKCNLGACRRVR